ncbi:nanos protein [Elysia marginata]|uniref:Nanos protein n=1 Tax=Elysia marginata TaxID=1093978 RepID=A0AAV4HU19_9GAST|nr:nanos protein [Elysia marginata]
MYALVGPSTLWPQASIPQNQQIFYGQFPAAYVVAPLPAQAILGPNVQPVVSSTHFSAWSNTPAAPTLTDYRVNNGARLSSSSDDDVFLPANPNTASSNTKSNRFTAPFLSYFPNVSRTSSSGPETPNFNLTNTKSRYCPSTSAIRLPEKYRKKSQGPKMNCKFCRNNGESEDVYTKHRLHDKERTVCPILRHYVCRLCNSTGDFAHTIRHCPFNDRKNDMALAATYMN